MHSSAENLKQSPLLVFVGCLLSISGVGALASVRLGFLGDALLLVPILLTLPWQLGPRSRLDLGLMTIFLGGLFIVYLLSSVAHNSLQAWKHTFQIIFCLAVFRFFFINSAELIRSRAFWISLVAALVLGIAASATPLTPAKNVASGYLSYVALTIGFLLALRLNRRRHLIVLTSFAVVAAIGFALDHRTMSGLGLFGALCYLALCLPNRRTVSVSILGGVAFVIIVIIAIFTQPEFQIYLRNIDQWFRIHTGRPALSGREFLWPILMKSLSYSPVFGLGAGMVPGGVFNTNLSAHNLYLQVALQTGILGTVILSGILLALWHLSRPTGNASSITSERVAVSMLAVIMIHNCFEVVLLQNALVVGTSAWMLLGLSLGNISQLRSRVTAP